MRFRPCMGNTVPHARWFNSDDQIAAVSHHHVCHLQVCFTILQNICVTSKLDIICPYMSIYVLHILLNQI